MKKLLLGLSLALGIMVITPTPVAHAWSWSDWFSKSDAEKKAVIQKKIYKFKTTYKEGWSSGRSVPELDPSTAGSALVLLIGGVAYVMSRRNEEEDVI